LAGEDPNCKVVAKKLRQRIAMAIRTARDTIKEYSKKHKELESELK
jgi:hypothetical protein